MSTRRAYDPSRRTLPSPGRLGITRPKGEEELSQLGWYTTEHLPLLLAVGRAPQPDNALASLLRVHDALGGADSTQWEELTSALHQSPRLLARFCALLGSSTTLAEHLITHPQHIYSLDNALPSRTDMFQHLLRAVNARPIQAEGNSDTDGASITLSTPGTYYAGITGGTAILAIRSAYRDLLCQIAAVDLAHTVDPTQPQPARRDTSELLTEAADAALTAVLAVAVATCIRTPEDYHHRLAVIAMGKCGARELNYISDIDVVFAADPADPTTMRLAGEFMRIGSHAVCEIDAGLRPEGKNGDLVRTVGSHLNYYRRWATTWEFQALLKARPMTGDASLAQEYMKAMYPLVWTACEREEFVHDVQEMRKRVEDNLAPSYADRELKLGSGGLRDVEFAVQLLQMVHGRTDQNLRIRATGEALDVLTQRGYISRDDGRELNEVYDFLRLLEHRLQLHHLHRTHMLPPPEDHSALLWLARASGISASANRDAAEELQDHIKKTRTRIRTLHEKLFYRPLLHAIAETDAQLVALDDTAMERQLAALGFANPRHTLIHLRYLTSLSGRAGRIQHLLLPMVLEKLSRTANPDAGLVDYRRLCEKLSSRSWFLRLLRDDGVVLERLVMICGTSRYAPDLLMSAPDVIPLLSGTKLTATPPQEIALALRASAQRHTNPEIAIGVARALRRAELARIACADILGMMSVEDVCASLSTIWIAVLEAGLDVIQRSLLDEGETEPPADIAVIGMGRLGGGEIGYGSDADVMFVCRPRQPDTSPDRAVRWANEVITVLQKLLKKPSTDPPLELDMDLRPEGKKGALVRTLESYRTYYTNWAEPWERQALLRAIPLAGDEQLGRDFIDMIQPVRYPREVSAQLTQQIRRMKLRVENERMPHGVDPKLHTKLGRGGLSDIEWTVQLLQIEHAAHHPELHVTSTEQALRAATQCGLISLDDEDTLRIAWMRATATRNALVLAKGKSVDVIPSHGSLLASVAAICQWPVNAGAEYLENYLKSTRRAHNVVKRLFWGE